jgi:glycogen debranching enzyme
MSEAAPAIDGAGRPERDPVSMREAVGYGAIDCAHQSAIDEALVAKHDRLFVLVDAHGDISPPGNCGLGLFHDDTRILSHCALTFSAGTAALLSSRSTEMYSLQVDLAITDAPFGGDAWDPKNAVHIRREILLHDRMTERATLTNFLTRPVSLEVRLSLGCDFADIFEVRGWKRESRGQFFEPEVGDRAVCYGYRGVDGRLMKSHVRFREAPTELDGCGAVWRLSLEPNERHTLLWEVLPETAADDRPMVEQPLLDHARLAGLYDQWRDGCASWSSDVAEFDRALAQSATDLRGLYGQVDGDHIIYAGIPWYTTVFGRDSLITSLQALPLNPRIAVDTLRYLARHQGEREDPFTEEQPGKIMHELRRGELARAGEIPHLPYYGTIDATPLWLILLHETWRWTGDEALVRELLPHAIRALEWIDRYGDIDGDGFVEYHRTSEKGLVNQGWKDSGDGVPFPDGTLPEPPIALVEVQGYVHDAKLRMAHLFRAVGQGQAGDALGAQAAVLGAAIRDRFWMDELDTFAVALDGEKRPIPTATSNAGHLLWSRVPGPEQAERMARHFMSPEMFSGWGLRTLSAAHRVYNPMSYHNGSVWPHDNAIVALGLSLAGHKSAALPILSGLHDASGGFMNHRLPELFCGMDRGRSRAPVHYPVSCIPQAWAAGAVFMLLQAVTGILPDAPAGCLHVRAPQLPSFLRDLTVTRLRIGGSEVTMRFARDNSRTVANLLDVQGDPLRVVIEV